MEDCRDAAPLLPLLLLPRPAAVRSGPLVESGFQSTLSTLLVRLGVDHPHHTLYQVKGDLVLMSQQLACPPVLVGPMSAWGGGCRRALPASFP